VQRKFLRKSFIIQTLTKYYEEGQIKENVIYSTLLGWINSYENVLEKHEEEEPIG
jgi:hypothetical protein